MPDLRKRPTMHRRALWKLKTETESTGLSLCLISVMQETTGFLYAIRTNPHLLRAAQITEQLGGPSFKPISYIPVFTLLFATLFVLAFYIWSALGLRGLPRGTLSSALISFFHGLFAANLAARALVTAYPFKMDDRNTQDQELLLQFSAAYMIVDFFMFLIPYSPTDVLFIGHHIMTTWYMLTAMYLGRGALSCLLLMGLGESTSLLQNGWYMARFLRQDYKVADDAFVWLSPIYTYVFVFVRSVVAPFLIPWEAYHLVVSATKIPLWHRSIWAFLAILTTAGSQIWSYKLWKGLKKSQRKAAEKKTT